jgi:MinD superfamily P-loop ATPase
LIVAVASGKDGTGKTTITAAFYGPSEKYCGRGL